jgi:hypothetical protein
VAEQTEGGIPFEFHPGQAPRIVVADHSGKKWSVAFLVSVLQVRPLGTTDKQTGHPLWEVNFQVTMQTKAVP